MTTADTKQTLDSIEKLLVSDLANPREALEAAYRLGQIDGLLNQNAYVEKMIRRDQRERHEGRDEHDMNTRYEPLGSRR